MVVFTVFFYRFNQDNLKNVVTESENLQVFFF